MTDRICSIICGLLISLGAAAQETTIVQLEDTGEALINPGMGWTMHFYSNVAHNYCFKLEPSDTLEDFPVCRLFTYVFHGPTIAMPLKEDDG
ncbi:MAG: hypothetical protein ACPGF8_03200, partial [Opitutales bacterium]